MEDGGAHCNPICRLLSARFLLLFDDDLPPQRPLHFNLFKMLALRFRNIDPREHALAEAHHRQKAEGNAFADDVKGIGKQQDENAFATHWIRTGTVIAMPRTSLGKISGTSVQNTGPMQAQKKAR